MGVYERFRSLIKNYGLKWRGKRTEDLIIDRLLKAKDPDEVFEWIREVKRRILDLRDFMDLVTAAGLRFNETVESYNLIVKLAGEGRLGEYFNAEAGALEHYRFREVFIREGKKAS